MLQPSSEEFVSKSCSTGMHLCAALPLLGSSCLILDLCLLIAFLVAGSLADFHREGTKS